MPRFIKDNIVLVLGVSLPLLLVALFMLASILPALFVDNPKYDLLFTDTNYSQLQFEVVNGKLQLKLNPNQYANPTVPALYRYSAATGKVQKLTFTVPDLPKIVQPNNNNANINASINIPVDPAKPPTEEQARNTAKAIAEIRANNPAAQITTFPVPELANLQLDNSREAPDGYVFDYSRSGYYGGNFFWGYGGYSDTRAVLVKDGKRVPLRINAAGPDYYGSATFVAWIVTP